MPNYQFCTFSCLLQLNDDENHQRTLDHADVSTVFFFFFFCFFFGGGGGERGALRFCSAFVEIFYIKKKTNSKLT